MRIETIGHTWHLRSTLLAAATILFLSPPPSPSAAHAAGDDAAPVIDNARVTVFDVTLAPGKSWKAPAGVDFAEMILVGGKITTTTPSGASTTASRKSGEVVYVSKGEAATLESASTDPVRIIAVELKGPAVPPLPNHSGHPLAFPRPGTTKVFENDRIVGWNSTWTLNVPTNVHYHDKDVVVVFTDSGSIKSTPLNGDATVGDVSFGTIRFSKSDRTHSEELIKGKASAIVLELKS